MQWKPLWLLAPAIALPEDMEPMQFSSSLSETVDLFPVPSADADPSKFVPKRIDKNYTESVTENP